MRRLRSSTRWLWRGGGACWSNTRGAIAWRGSSTRCRLGFFHGDERFGGLAGAGAGIDEGHAAQGQRAAGKTQHAGEALAVGPGEEDGQRRNDVEETHHARG